LVFKSSNNFLTEETLIILFLIAVLISSFSQELLKLEYKINKLINPILSVLTNNVFLTIIIGLITIFILYQIYKIINNKIEKIKEEKQRIKEEVMYIDNFLKEDIDKLTKEGLKSLIKESKDKLFHEKTLKYYREDMKNNLAKARKLLGLASQAVTAAKPTFACFRSVEDNAFALAA
jgi:NADH:ubiquinone oxidoreductase subunit 5 (subunit L)/multisubunit Na+/H+ antiporter MnhA subunit